jgi:hypothetical protein
MNIEYYKIIIIENNGNNVNNIGSRYSFLSSMDCDIFLTNNNRLPVSNKGIKELQDIFDCIDHCNIRDNDFIVKLTGRYILDDNSEFMNVVKNNHITNYDCIIKYGSLYKPVDYKTNECITGLIGMRCSYVKKIINPTNDECVEWKWGEVTNLIDDAKIYMVNTLGVNICPGSNDYFFV